MSEYVLAGRVRFSAPWSAPSSHLNHGTPSIPCISSIALGVTFLTLFDEFSLFDRNGRGVGAGESCNMASITGCPPDRIGLVGAGSAGRLLSNTAGPPPDVVLFAGLPFVNVLVFFLLRAMRLS